MNFETIIKIIAILLIVSLGFTAMNIVNSILVIPASAAGLSMGWVRIAEYILIGYICYNTYQLKGWALFLRLIIICLLMWAKPLAQHIIDFIAQIPTV